MAKSELKTKETDASVEDYVNALTDEVQRADSVAVIGLFKRATGEQPRMWGPAIIGFGHQVLKYDSGRELDWMITGFSPRKGKFAFYGLNKDSEQMSALGKHKTGKGCLYIRRLADVDQSILEQLIERSIRKDI